MNMYTHCCVHVHVQCKYMYNYTKTNYTSHWRERGGERMASSPSSPSSDHLCNSQRVTNDHWRNGLFLSMVQHHRHVLQVYLISLKQHEPLIKHHHGLGQHRPHTVDVRRPPAFDPLTTWGCYQQMYICIYAVFMCMYIHTNWAEAVKRGENKV